MDINSLLALPEDELIIDYKIFKKKYIKGLDEIENLSKRKKIKKSEELNLSIEKQIKSGCNNLGMYHAVKPIKIQNNNLIIKNIKMLFYYRNRLNGFKIEKVF